MYVRLHRVTLTQAKENETFPCYLHLPLGTGFAKILYTNILSLSLSLSLSLCLSTGYFLLMVQLSSMSYHLFSFCRSIQDYKIHMDMEIVTFLGIKK